MREGIRCRWRQMTRRGVKRGAAQCVTLTNWASFAEGHRTDAV